MKATGQKFKFSHFVKMVQELKVERLGGSSCHQSAEEPSLVGMTRGQPQGAEWERLTRWGFKARHLTALRTVSLGF